MALGLPGQLHSAVLAGEQGARNIWEVTHLQQGQAVDGRLRQSSPLV